MLVGASGCGKTSLLKMINKLILPDAGSISVAGTDIREWDTIELRRSIGYVIQQTGLFPHMNIEQNMCYVQSIQNMPRPTQQKRARELAQLIGLPNSILSRYPRELSGGQNQRVGVARALAADPDIILMDEPFGAVDEITRRKLQRELKELHARLHKTIIFVTHDIEEALRLADTIVLLHNGKIEQQGSPRELIAKPASPYVRQFFGAQGLRALLDEQALDQLYQRLLDGDETLEGLLRKETETK